MRLAPLVVAPFLLLAGCQTTQTADVISKIIAATQVACGFVPTAGTVAQIIATFNAPAGLTASTIVQIAQGICGSVVAPVNPLPLPGAKSVHLPTYRGVVIRGKFK